MSPLGSAVLSVTTLRAGTVNNVTPDEARLGGTLRALTHADMERLRRRVGEVAAAVAAAHGCTAEVDWHEGDHPYYPPTVNDGRAAALVAGAAEALMDGWVARPFAPEGEAGAGAEGTGAETATASGSGKGKGKGGDEEDGVGAPGSPSSPSPAMAMPATLSPYTPSSKHTFETEPVMPAEDFSFFARALPSAFSFLGAADPSGPGGGGGGLLHNPLFSLDERVLPVGAAIHAAVAAEYFARGGLEGTGAAAAAAGCSSAAAGGGACPAAAA
jgi:metal-dependent amidase/aminoacylase/carboxypeptidase family protein